MDVNGVAYEKVSTFVLRFSVKVGLQNINWDKINQFRVSGDLGKYLKAKRRLCEQVKLNMSQIEQEMGVPDSGYSKAEVIIIRSVYLQHKQAKETVENHIEQIKTIVKWQEKQGKMLDDRLAEKVREDDNELPF